MSPTDHGGTRWSSLGRSFGATPTHEGMDPEGRLYQTGIGTIHPQPQTNALDWYTNCCGNGVVAGLVRDNKTKTNQEMRLCAVHKKLHVDRVYQNQVADPVSF